MIAKNASRLIFSVRVRGYDPGSGGIASTEDDEVV